MDQVTKLLLETSQQLFADGCEPELQAAAEEGEFPSELWQAIEDNGLTQALVPESAGGVDVGLESACAVLRVAGAFALPLPLGDTMLGAQVLAASDIPIPDGTLAVACDTNSDGLVCEDGHWSGKVDSIPWLPAVDSVVLVADRTEGSSVAVVSTDQLASAIARRKDPAGEPIGDLSFGSNGLALATHRCSLSQTWMLHTAALMRVSLIAGALDRVLDMCIEHATSRVQFGRPVAKFQAVQNLVAVIAGEAAAVGVSAPAAVRAWAQEQDELAVGCAKTRAAEAASLTAKTAHQVHAAIGFTQEHILHRFTRRLWSWRDHFGDENYWSGRVGQQTLQAGGDGIWPRLTQYG